MDAGGNLPGSAKLTYLRSYLTGYAYKIISHLSITDDNFDIAITLLKDEFLDTEFIADEYFRQIIKASPKYDQSFENVRQFLNETRAALHELKAYNIDLLEEDTSGNKLISHIIFDKLPNIIKRELVHKVDSNFPTVNQLFDNYNDILKTLSRTSYKKDYDKQKSQSSTPVKSQNGSSSKVRNDKGQRNHTGEKSKPCTTLENFQTKTEKSGTYKSHCKFCNTSNHSMFLCPKYSSHNARNNRCKELNLCSLCSSSKHMSKDCFGKDNRLSYECKICKSKGHISALCVKYEHRANENSSHTNICINSGIQTQDYILPIMNITAKRGKNKYQFNCLIDTGSQRSYLSPQVIEKLNINLSEYSSLYYEVSTFLGAKKKELKQMVLDIDYSPGKTVPLPILVDEDFNLEFNVSDFPNVISNIKNLGFKFAADLHEESSLVKVDGLIGVDLIQYMDSMEIIECMYGSAWQIPQGIIPFGNAQNFLYRSQITPSEVSQENVNHYSTIISQFSSVPTTHINFVLNPKQSYFDPLSEVFSESQVERNIDKMFSCESLGISDDQESTSDYDKAKIREFEESIEYKDNSYHIKLPWHEDKISSVPSNHEVALSVLNRVVTKLENQGLWNAYVDVFKQQEEEGIIERFEVKPQNFSDYIWIPHRPVIKSEQQVTTKIRPVFNCSLKTQGRCSLNEAAYPGINLLTDMLDLLLMFRSNKHVMLADIRKAYLMIKLSHEKDRSRFCFFMKENDKLICYRYTTLIFGFNASPFILNFVIKHHARKFPQDGCTEMLLRNFYVDNLIKTSNSISELFQLYTEAFDRMQKGNFELRSWNTNCEDLKQQMIEDHNFVEHGCELEKVLGYKYSTLNDTIQLSDAHIDFDVKTKRGILSQTSKMFDPLSLCLPVTVRGKVLLRDLWSQKVGWDEEINSDSFAKWSALSKDLSQLTSIEFPRFCIDKDKPSELYIFCDSSKQAYGFAAYNVQDGKSSLIFAKAKVAPMKSKSLPTLELLSVFLAVKCLPTLLDAYSQGMIHNVTISVDAQVVLAWLLSEEIKTKNQFAKNRLRYSSIDQGYPGKVFYKYQFQICSLRVKPC